MAERKLTPTHEAPYRGLRVLDFGQGIASPYCAMLLGVYGADVIKVEPPEGDWSRYLGTTYGNHTTLSAVYNRGKRSLCLDMKHKDAIAIARRLAKDCDVLIFDEPTRGIDVGAKEEIYQLLGELAAQGKSIVMISSELPEILRMSHRVVVMSEGRVTRVLDAADATQEDIMHYATLRPDENPADAAELGLDIADRKQKAGQP